MALLADTLFSCIGEVKDYGSVMKFGSRYHITIQRGYTYCRWMLGVDGAEERTERGDEVSRVRQRD